MAAQILLQDGNLMNQSTAKTKVLLPAAAQSVKMSYH